MRNYSPEPWKVVGNKVFDAGGAEVILEAINLNGQPENLIRLVAAVNACVSIPTDMLQTLPPEALYKALVRFKETP